MTKTFSQLVVFMIVCLSMAKAIDAGEFDDLVGYTVVACTHAAGELEGADFDKLVKLDNGMIFEFQTYSYFYAYRPDVVVFGKTVEFQGQIGDAPQTCDCGRG